MVDFSKFDIDKNDLLTTIAYKLAESPSTQAFNSVAAQNNPDWAGFTGSIMRMGDVDRADFNLGLQALTASNAAKEARAKEQRGYNHLEKMYNLKRQHALADRNRAEKLQLMTLPQEELISTAADWQNSVNPEQQQFINAYNSAVTAKNNANSYEDYIKNDRILKDLRKKQMFNSKVKAPNTNTKSREYLEGQVSPVKKHAIKLSEIFGNKEAQNRIGALEAVANKSRNVFNDPNRETNKGLSGLFNNIFGDTRLANLEDFMRNKQIGQVSWNSSDKAIEIAKKLMINDEIREIFGTNDLNDFVLLDDPTTFGMNKTYIVDKNTNKPYQILVDETGTLRLYDPYEE